MKRFLSYIRSGSLKLLLSGLLLFCLSERASGATYTWTGLGLNGKWSTPLNWGSLTNYPVAGDDVVIAQVLAGFTITLDVNVTVHSITTYAVLGVLGLAAINTGTTAGNAHSLTVTGFFTEGQLLGTGVTPTVLYPGTFSISGTGAVTLNGTVTVYTGNILNLGQTGESINISGATVNIADFAAGNIVSGLLTLLLADGGQPTINNYGLLNATSSSVFNLSGYYSQLVNSGSGAIFNLGSTSTINLTGSHSDVSNTGTFSLLSDQSSTATIGPISSGSSGLQGTYNVQRYITGGSGYRGYRLMSSPVNVTNNSSNPQYFSLAYLNGSQTVNGTTCPGIYTAGQGTGFSATNINPIIYLYDESRTTDNSTFVSGKNVGIYSITTNTVTTISGKPAVQTTGVSIPVGNSFLLYFLGNTSVGTLKSTSPPAATTTAIGYLNQGSIPVTFWNTGSTSIPYHTATPGAGGLSGYNQVGNPYASTIILDQVVIDNPAISPIFWEMNGSGSVYYSYNGSTHTSSNTSAGKYIVSGQGFIMDATATGQTITFNEDQKVAYPAITATSTPALLLAVKPQLPSVLSGLHLELSRDSATNTQTGIYFSSEWSDAFNDREDAIDLDGASPVVYLSSYSSDGKRLGINQLNTIGKGKVVKLYVNTTANGQYSISLADIQNVDTVYDIYLRDHYKKDSLDIGRYRTYLFDVTKSDTNSFGSTRFDLSIHPRPLAAYRLNLFTAQKVTGGVKISWNTSNEGDYTGFVLQKMKNGMVQYLSIDSLQSDGRGNYFYIDNNPNTTGNNTYRLQQNDVNDNLSYSSIINVNYSGSGNSMMVYPNPAKESISVNILTSVSTSAAIVYKANIYNAVGQLVLQKSVGSNSWTQDITQYKPGAYVIQMTDSSGNLIGASKFVKTN